MIFVTQTAVGLIEKVVEELGFEITIVVFGETTDHVKFEEFQICDPNEDGYKPIEVNSLNETALVAFSSGTTGTPKGIKHSHLGILSNNMFSEITNSITLASFCSLYWTIYHIFIHVSIMNGFERLIFANLDLKNPWKIVNHKIDSTFVNGIQCISFIKTERPKHVNLSNIGELSVGGNHMTNERMLQVRACFPKTTIFHTYGQTELFSNVCTFPNTPTGNKLREKYPNSVGLPVIGINYKIVDLDTEEILGPNKLGELRLKSKCQTTGYYNRDSSELFDKDGWLKTGDLAYYNEEKCFFISSRIKESFKYLNHHISPIEIENVIRTHPSIKNAAVIGLPHNTDDNHPLAVIELSENAKNVTPEEIIQYVEERVEDKKRLRGGVRIIPKIPVTVSNKINRFKLRDMLKNNEI